VCCEVDYSIIFISLYQGFFHLIPPPICLIVSYSFSHPFFPPFTNPHEFASLSSRLARGPFFNVSSCFGAEFLENAGFPLRRHQECFLSPFITVPIAFPRSQVWSCMLHPPTANVMVPLRLFSALAESPLLANNTFRRCLREKSFFPKRRRDLLSSPSGYDVFFTPSSLTHPLRSIPW